MKLTDHDERGVSIRRLPGGYLSAEIPAEGVEDLMSLILITPEVDQRPGWPIVWHVRISDELLNEPGEAIVAAMQLAFLELRACRGAVR